MQKKHRKYRGWTVDRTERFHKIDQMISGRQVVTFDVLPEAIEVSPATLKRDLQCLRDRLHVPIILDREASGYQYEKGNAPSGSQFELPGLWFNSSEGYK